MEKNSKIYVAGHTGLVGSAIARGLHDAGYSHILTAAREELDLTRQQAVEDFFARHQPEYVFLAAAKVGGILANSTYKAEFIYDNLIIAANVIEAAHRYKVKKLLNLGSSCIYPKHAPQPMKEEYLLSGPLEPTNEAYAMAKIAAIKLCRYYNEQYGTNFISVMPTNLYGPGDNFNLETAHVLPALIRKFHLAKLLHAQNFQAIRADLKRYPLGRGLDEGLVNARNQDITQVLQKAGITADAVALWGTGEVFREFLYVDDAASACIFLMQRHEYADIGEIINIGSGIDSKIHELAAVVQKVVGFNGCIIWDSSKPDGTPRKLLDVSCMQKLGWQAQITMEKGIAVAYEYFRRQ